uniref:Uncharacterized protein n=1 Tax=Octopus bimaculoides TaxID=37653 RepID=A0A0L8G997_OCTBM
MGTTRISFLATGPAVCWRPQKKKKKEQGWVGRRLQQCCFQIKGNCQRNKGRERKRVTIIARNKNISYGLEFHSKKSKNNNN